MFIEDILEATEHFIYLHAVPPVRKDYKDGKVEVLAVFKEACT